MRSSTSVRGLLDQAAAARAAGRGADAARLFDQAVEIARTAEDLPAWTEAVLGAASVQVFGAEPGRLAAQLYDVLVRTTSDPSRARLCAALARCWAYAGHPDRAVQFAEEAVVRAEACAEAELLADSLDSALAAHWGPDELPARRALAARLDDVAAHVLDPDARLRAVLWGLQVACESLEIPTIHRQMKALERLGEESERALFFAASRRLMLDLLRGRTDTADRLIALAESAAESSSLADASLVILAMRSYAAAVAGDRETCRAGAEVAEQFGESEGFTAVSAEAAFLWSCAGDRVRAGRLLQSFHGGVLEDLPRDVNWLLVLQCLLEAALFVEDRELVAAAAGLLTGYEGRAVFNAGAVMFHGVTDDSLGRAALLLGDTATAEPLLAAARATYERLGAQWWSARLASWPRPIGPPLEPVPGALPRTVRRAHLHPAAGGAWSVGIEPSVLSVSPLKGFSYLRVLLRRPAIPVRALDLVGAGHGVVLASGLGEVVDAQALAAYRQRLRELDVELAEADVAADQHRSTELSSERQALLAEVSRATGLGGRARMTGSSDERARVAVRKSIASAIERIGAVDEPLGRHLRARIRTGLSCSYDPDPDAPLDWVLS